MRSLGLLGTSGHPGDTLQLTIICTFQQKRGTLWKGTRWRGKLYTAGWGIRWSVVLFFRGSWENRSTLIMLIICQRGESLFTDIIPRLPCEVSKCITSLLKINSEIEASWAQVQKPAFKPSTSRELRESKPDASGRGRKLDRAGTSLLWYCYSTRTWNLKHCENPDH